LATKQNVASTKWNGFDIVAGVEGALNSGVTGPRFTKFTNNIAI